MPTPVSLDGDAHHRAAGILRVDVGLDHDFALQGEFDRIADQIEHDLADLNGSPSKVEEQGSGGQTINSMPLASAAPANSVALSSSMRSRSRGSDSISTLPACIFDRSRRSLTICSRICAEDRMVWVSLACVERERGSPQQFRHSDDAVHRRSQLVTHARQEIALGLRSLRQLPIALDQLVRSRRDLGLQSLFGADDAQDLGAVRPNPVDDEEEQGESVDRVGPRRAPGRGISVDGQPQRRIAPDRIRIGGADLEQMVARIQVGERHPVLCTQVDPSIGEPRHPIGEPIALGRVEVERAEIERDDARL